MLKALICQELTDGLSIMAIDDDDLPMIRSDNDFIVREHLRKIVFKPLQYHH